MPPCREPRRPRVLLVEDRLAQMFAMKDLFAREGWEVSVGRTLDEAMEGLRQSPDWVVLNLGLADDGGTRFLRRMRAEGDRTPVVALSPAEGFNDRGLATLRRAGPVVALPQPIDFCRLYGVCSGGHQADAGAA